MNKKLGTICAISAFVAAGSAAHANLMGSVWENDFSDDASVIPSGTPDGTFTSSGINYNSNVGGYTIGGFLNNPTWLTGSGIAGDDGNNIHVQLTDTIFLNAGANNFNVEHDDGLIIDVAGIGLVLNDPGPTSPVLTPFTITAPVAGLYSFTLDYNECCGAPSELIWQYPDGTPVGTVPDGGSTLAFLGGALTLLGTITRRFRK